jgi:hypothetical protein
MAVISLTLEERLMEQVEDRVESGTRPSPVRIRKLGHIVLQVRDVERSIKFYTGS